MITLLVEDEVWNAGTVGYRDGTTESVPRVTEGLPLEVLTWPGHVYTIGESYYLWLNYVFSVQQPSQWRAWLALDAATRQPIPGTDAAVPTEIDAILSDDEAAADAVTALVELADEQREWLTQTNLTGQATTAIGPRTARLEALYAVPTPDPLTDWLALPPSVRPIGSAVEDLPPGAVEALDTPLTTTEVLILFDEQARAQAPAGVGIATSIGITSAFALPPEGGALSFSFIHPDSGAIQVIGWETSTAAGYEPIGPELAARLPRSVDGGLFIDLRSGRPRLEILDQQSFRSLVEEHTLR